MAEDSFDDMLERLRAADSMAATDLFRRFSRRLIGLARTRLQGAMQRKVDPEDVMQSVFRSFFRRQADDQFELHGWDNLWSLLACITLRKCGHKIEYYLAECRDVRREADAAPAASNESISSYEAIAREPTPAEAVMLTETVEHLLRGLSERDRTIVEMILQGETVAWISQQAKCSERTIERVQKRLREQLEGMIG